LFSQYNMTVGFRVLPCFNAESQAFRPSKMEKTLPGFFYCPSIVALVSGEMKRKEGEEGNPLSNE
ncbi:MAG TPA: hypothetical protein VN611_01470, partial [Patescibacteria group bacterium]|nr:hypothetical protein [Patescibacteria group bacterium]